MTSLRPRDGLPWLVFLPGLTADRSLFEPQLAHFAGRANCLAWDAPAHGASRPFELAFDMDDLVEWLHRILRCEGVRRPVLVGQSLGGYVAQAYRAAYPHEVAGLVSVDSGPLDPSFYPAWELALLRHVEGMYRAFPWRLLLWWGSRGVARTPAGRASMRAMMGRYAKREYCALVGHGYRLLADAIGAAGEGAAHAASGGDDAADGTFAAGGAAGEGRRGGAVRGAGEGFSAGDAAKRAKGARHRSTDAAGRAKDGRHRSADVAAARAPTLLLCGEHDAAGDVRVLNRRWSARTGLPVEWVAGAGHNATVDNPVAVNRAIEDFVGRCCG